MGTSIFHIYNDLWSKCWEGIVDSEPFIIYRQNSFEMFLEKSSTHKTILLRHHLILGKRLIRCCLPEIWKAKGIKFIGYLF